MEWLVLSLFCSGLLVSVLLGISILYPLFAGLLIFFVYGRAKGFSAYALAKMAVDGILTAKNILITFFLIGMLTGIWRAAGTIPVIVFYASGLIRLPVFLIMVFLLNCAVSVLTGTSFGTAATIGVVCMTLADALGISTAVCGGAVLSGIYFGDRCSPVSTSALLVAELTNTDIFVNIKRMIRPSVLPFTAACAVYAAAGFVFTADAGGSAAALKAVFEREFNLSPLTLIPAVVILVLSLVRVNVKLSMTASILAAVPLCIVLQGASWGDTALYMLRGFSAANAQADAMLSGGGVVSMLKVAGIVCISSAYSGIFKETGLLDNIKAALHRLANVSTSYIASLITSVLTSMAVCNQTLAIMLTQQLCGELEEDAYEFANDLEDTAVIVPALVPWSIACAVPLSSIGVPTQAVIFACYLYLLPLWRCLISVVLKQRRK